jgi:hypothetical protein
MIDCVAEPGVETLNIGLGLVAYVDRSGVQAILDKSISWAGKVPRVLPPR